MHKSTGTSGSQMSVETQYTFEQRNEFVVSAPIDLNALNGVFIMRDSESGVDSLLSKEKASAVN